MKYAIFSEAGAFKRIDEQDPDTLPPIPFADDGAPRAVPVKAIPEHDPMTEELVIQRDGGWKVVALSEEKIERIAEDAAKQAALEKAKSEAEAEFAKDASTMTADQRIARLEKLIIGLIAKTDPSKIEAVAAEAAVVKG